MAAKKICSTCLRPISSENAPVLVMGAYGNPKLLCDECAALIDTITLGRDYNEIEESMQTLTDRMSASNVDDRFTIATVTEILADSAVRAQKIKEGPYDFALDDAVDEDAMDDIPEELRETEEDRLLDEKDAEANAKFDKFLNWMWVGVGIAAACFLVWKIIEFVFIK